MNFSLQLDRAERALTGQPTGVHGPSANMDASGNFSIGVIEKCLARFGLQAINVMRSDVKDDALLRPGSYEDGFIFNLSEHWFSVRRVCRMGSLIRSFLNSDPPLVVTDLESYFMDARIP